MTTKACIAFLIFSAALVNAEILPATNAPPNPSGDLLQFLDGSALHGELKLMDAAHGVRWQHPEAKSAIEFKPTNIDSIRFAQSKTMTLEPACHFRFANGDELFASLTSLDAEKIGLIPWFGTEMKIPRSSVQTITFLSKKFSILYEGPDGAADGWKFGNNNYNGAPANNWRYRDGAFVCNGAGFLGRDFSLTNSSSIEFDLVWGGQFQMLLSIYTDAIDHLDYGVSSYMLTLSPENVGLQRIQANGMPNNFGSVALPNPNKKNKLRFEIRANHDEGTVAVFADHILAKRWKDSAGFVGRGTGVLFYAMTSAAQIRMSNIKVTQWDGKFEPDDSSNTQTNADAVSLINHDKAAGQVRAMKNGKLTLLVGEKTLDIPVARVTQIDLAASNAVVAARSPWEVRAHFPGGGRLSFQLEKWDDNKISGRSAILGPLAFQPRLIRQIEFNLDRERETDAAPVDEFGGLDE